MAWVIVGAAAVSVGASLISSRASSKATSKAAKAAAKSGDKATAAQLEMFYKSLELDEPFREQQLEAGKMGLEARKELKGIAGDLYTRATDPESDPIAQFQMKQFEKRRAKLGLQRSNVAYEDIGVVGASEAMRREGLLTARRGIYTQLAGGSAGTSATAGLAVETGRGLASSYQSTGQGLQKAAYARGQSMSNMWKEMGNIGSTGIAAWFKNQQVA